MARPLPADEASPAPASSINERLQVLLPKLVLSPSVVLVLIFVYGFIAFTGYLSFTGSRILPSFELVGIDNYVRLFSLRNWSIALKNLAIFGVLYIAICTAIGLFLAILLDQKIRGEGVLRPIYLYPMALSFIVTGTAWKWFLTRASDCRTPCTCGVGRASSSPGSRTATWRSTPSCWRRCGSRPGS